MKIKKQVLIMIIAIVALALIALVALNVGPNRQQRKRSTQPILGSIKLDNVKSFEINDRLSFKQDGNVWSYMQKVGDDYIPKPTRQDYVQEMIDALADFSRGKLVDSAPEDLSKYNLNDADSARILILEDAKGEQLLKLRVGVVVGTLSANYAQINDNQAVYRIDNQNLTYYLNQGEQYWLDLRLLPSGLDEKRIKSIKISKRDRDDIVLIKNRKEWVADGNDSVKIDSEKVSSYIQVLNEINAYSFSSPVLKDDIKDGKIEIKLTSNDVIEINLYFFANKYFITTKGGREGEILSFQEYSIDKLYPEISSFMNEAAATIDASQSSPANDNQDSNEE